MPVCCVRHQLQQLLAIMNDLDSCAALMFAARTMLFRDALVRPSCQGLVRWISGESPQCPYRWIVALSPVPMHLDEQLGVLLQIFGVQQIDRVSFEEIHVPLYSMKTLMDLMALKRCKLQVTLLEAGPVTNSLQQARAPMRMVPSRWPSKKIPKRGRGHSRFQ